jgi:hypothetical protein
VKIAEIQNKLSHILRAYGITYAAVFGSVSRDEATPESDVDILIKLGKPMGLFTYSRLIREMEEILHRKVDLVTDKSLNKFIKPYVLPELKTMYEI